VPVTVLVGALAAILMRRSVLRATPARTFRAASAAGGGITGGRSNDGLWLFSLNGTMEPLPPGSGDRPSDDLEFEIPEEAGAGDVRSAVLTAIDPDREPDMQRGESIYQSFCISCHGPTGEGGTVEAAVLSDDLDVADVIGTAYHGVEGTAMVLFSETYSFRELHNVEAYIVDEVLADR
jgi:mono/diheme cytochrome c family protein